MSLTSIIIFFILTATAGITLFTYVWRGKNRPLFLVAVHGLLALSAYALLNYYAATEETQGIAMGTLKGAPNNSIIFFSLAAVGGIAMFIRDKVLKLGLKKWMPMVHGGAAIIGLVLLIIYAFFE